MPLTPFFLASVVDTYKERLSKPRVEAAGQISPEHGLGLDREQGEGGQRARGRAEHEKPQLSSARHRKAPVRCYGQVCLRN